MKTSRLLEIIREEISSALNELTVVDKKTLPTEAPEIAKSENTDINTVKNAIAQAKKSGKPVNVAEAEELEEDLLNEMAWNIVIANPKEKERIQAKISGSTKKGEQKLAKALEILDDRTSKGLKTRIRDISDEMGVRQQEINPLIGALVDVGVLEKGESVTGVTKKKITDKPQGRPSNPNKPEKAPSTGQRGRKPGTKVATRTTGDDGFDTVTYSDVDIDVEDEDVFDTEKAPAGDVEMEKAARNRDELIKQYKTEVEPELKDKIAKAKGGDTEAMSWLKSKQDIIKKYNQAKQVNV
jgi:hypothetical protein